MSGDIVSSSSRTPSVPKYEGAVVIREAFKSYGSFHVLNDLHMTVPKGAIYGLLGASGCGKTTLLGCIIGRKLLNKGDIYVFDQKIPNTRNEARISYMPQKNGLYGDFTIKEALLFFGRVLGMDQGQITEKLDYLVELLMLPDQNRPIKHMSGGQQRRISLAVALVNDAELLILDEPTVGLDSILRQMVWDHLVKLTEDVKVTIIITTHYIEEALRADLVGIMRGGCLIAEDSPKHLLSRHHAETFEEVFLKLSLVQERIERTNLEGLSHTKSERIEEKWVPKRSHLRAMIYKNSLLFGKRFSTLIYSVLLPMVVISIHCMAIGRNPSNIIMAVTNMEMGDCNTTGAICNGTGASCAFLHHLQLQYYGFIMHYYSSQAQAGAMVQQGEAHASIVIKKNFSIALRDRAHNGRHSSSLVLEESTIDIFRDLSESHLALYIRLALTKAFETFLQNFMESCGYKRNLMKIALKWDTVYEKLSFTDFALPGILIGLSFLIGVVTSGNAMNTERTEGDLERLFAMGIIKSELIISHLIVDCVVVIPQAFISMFISFILFEMVIKGSVLLTGAIIILSSVCGICYGLMLSSIIKTQTAIGIAAIITNISITLTSGMLWPIEGIHWLLKPITQIFPFTKSIESLRNILHRGRSFGDPEVYIGFVSFIVWTSIFLLLSILVMRIQRN